MPCRDVDGCVHVSIANKVAGYAGEERLALAALGCDVPACATALRSVSRADPLDPAGSLLFQSANQQSPARTHDLAVEPCFRTDVTSWVPSRTPGRARHTRDAQVLDTNQVEPPRKVRAGFLDPVFALRMSVSLARSRAIANFAWARRFDPLLARAILRCKRRNLRCRLGLSRGTISIWPVDSVALTAAPRSIPTTSPVPGERMGSGMATKEMCHRPARSRVTR